MKKILLLVSAFALLTGCSKTEHTPGASAAQKVDGIAFHANLDAETKGELNQDPVTKQWKMSWYAESDKMAVFSADIIDPMKPVATWTTSSKSYKATRTLGEGYFTAATAADIIDFKTDQNLSFRFVYPAPATAATVASNEISVELPVIATQTHAKLNGSDAVAEMFMVGAKDNVAPMNEANPAVADVLVGMQLSRPFPVAYFKLKNYDEDLYGALTSVTLTSLGTSKGVNATTGLAEYENPMQIDYGTGAKYNVETGEVTLATPVATGATLTTNVGVDWEDNTPIFMSMNTVDCSAGTKPEWVTITYKFANATFVETKALKTALSFEANKLYDMSNGGFDLAIQPYTMLNNGTLLLNSTFKGSVESLVKAGKIDLTPVTGIKEIISHVVLTPADLKYIGTNFTALAKVSLMENTEIPAFKGASQTITELIAPKVTVIDDMAFENATLELTDCALPSYDFKKATITKALLDETKLVNLDISSVDLIATTFPATGLSLQDFALLETVIVKSGVTVGTKAFDGCTALEAVLFAGDDVTGAGVNLIGEYAFSGCENLDMISILNTEIPAGAFNGCIILDLVLNGMLSDLNNAVTNIVPTKIGAEAFKGTMIDNIDLSMATEIGHSAFMGCTSLVGVEDATSGVDVLRVPKITELKDNVFSGCTSLKYIGFDKVTKVGNQFLTGTTCEEISFGEKITGATTKAGSFGATGGTILFVAKGQEGVANATLTFGTASAPIPFVFKAIKN